MLPYLPIRGGQPPQHLQDALQEAKRALRLSTGTHRSHLAPGPGLGPAVARHDALGDADGPALPWAKRAQGGEGLREIPIRVGRSNTLQPEEKKSPNLGETAVPLRPNLVFKKIPNTALPPKGAVFGIFPYLNTVFLRKYREGKNTGNTAPSGKKRYFRIYGGIFSVFPF